MNLKTFSHIYSLCIVQVLARSKAKCQVILLDYILFSRLYEDLLKIKLLLRGTAVFCVSLGLQSYIEVLYLPKYFVYRLIEDLQFSKKINK